MAATDPTTRRAVLYARVSKLTRGRRSRPDPLLRPEGKSVDQQLDELTKQALRDDVTIIGPYRDDGISASRFGGNQAREGWEQTMQAIVSGRATELWTWEISRATRDRPVWATLINACIASHVMISVNGRLHDPLDPDDGFMLDLQAALAVRESAVTSKRIRRDVAARAATGKPHGKIPYGYLRTYDPNTRDLIAQVPDPDTAPILAELAARVLAGESMYAVARDLDDRQVPSPETLRSRRVHGAQGAAVIRWRPETIRALLLSPTGAGQRTHCGMVVATADWPAVIGPADHAALQALLTGRGARPSRRIVRHLLTGIAECGVCGAGLRQVRNRNTPSYACPGHDRRGASCVTRAQAPVDAMVILRVVRRLRDPDLLAEMARDQVGAARRADGAAKELTDLRAELAAYVAAATQRKISAESFGQIEAGLLEQIAAVQVQVAARSRMPQVVLDLAGPDAADKWDALDDVVARRVVVRALLRVVVHRSTAPRGVRVFDESSVQITPR